MFQGLIVLMDWLANKFLSYWRGTNLVGLQGVIESVRVLAIRAQWRVWVRHKVACPNWQQ